WHHPKKLKATAWLLEVMTRPEDADTRPVFLIHHEELLGLLRLQDKGVEKSGLRYFTFNELKPLLGQIAEQGKKASALKAEDQTTFHKQVLKLANASMLYQRLKISLQPEGLDNFAGEVAEFSAALAPAQKAVEASNEGKEFDKELVRKLS